jgi:hypothetical protein
MPLRLAHPHGSRPLARLDHQALEVFSTFGSAFSKPFVDAGSHTATPLTQRG